MTRPASVTASAIVAVLGSLFALLIAGMAVASLFVQTPQPHPANAAQSVVGGAAIFAVFAVAGIWTSVGLFRMRPWARSSILVFAGFLALVCLFSLLMTTLMPISADFSAAAGGQTFRGTMAIVFAIPLAISLWWLVQFNTRSTRAAFATPFEASTSTRPLSITIIGWSAIVGALGVLMIALMRSPVFLFGWSFGGWPATVFYVFLAALSAYMGKGLLQLRESARRLAIAWFGFGLVHISVVALVPSIRARMLALQQSISANQSQPIPFDINTFMNAMFVFVAITTAVAIWFLIRNRAAFMRTETA
jgi:hypothetical protein